MQQTGDLGLGIIGADGTGTVVCGENNFPVLTLNFPNDHQPPSEAASAPPSESAAPKKQHRKKHRKKHGESSTAKAAPKADQPDFFVADLRRCVHSPGRFEISPCRC
jgi:hypothetical protein